MEQNNKDISPLGYFTLALLGVIIAFAICGILSSCSPKVVEKVITKVEVKEHIVTDTVNIQVPVEVEKIVTKDTSSHLENTFAKSDAVVSGGFLSHSLESKSQIIRVPVEVVVRDTLFVQQESKVETVYKEKELTRWQKFRLVAFWWLVAGLLLSLCWIFKPLIVKLIK